MKLRTGRGKDGKEKGNVDLEQSRREGMKTRKTRNKGRQAGRNGG